ncbi:hypothetical protein ACFWZA_01840 [[Kitasatospora] papulosa]|uniref:hypothetical protein n=1 Tax=[Kitasatospora] papulosa TaxID=1464011 RepID=UPI0036CF8BC5
MTSPQNTLLVLSPPRSCSTLIARMLWQHPALTRYAMEPFDAVGTGEVSSEDALRAAATGRPLSALVDGKECGSMGDGLLIKEITYQADPYFEALLGLTARPVLFAMRDPRMTVRSRMRKFREGGLPAIFPTEETGWRALHRQVGVCASRGIPYALVDGTLLQSDPARMAPLVFQTLNLDFSESLLSWQPVTAAEFGVGQGAHDYFFDQAMDSRGIDPPRDETPDLESFPLEGGLRAHVRECLQWYAELSEDDHCLRPKVRADAEG